MKPLPDLPDRRDRREGPDPTADRALWTLVFIGLGTLIVSNLPPEREGWWILFAAVSFAGAAYFMFLLLVRRDR